MNYLIGYMITIDKQKDGEILEDHIAYLEDQIKAGNILAKGPFHDHTGGMIIFNVSTIKEAREIVKNDPAAMEETREFIIKEWKCSTKLASHYEI